MALADDTDMGGSLRNPSSWCSVVGLRPSVGRVPMAPAVMAYNALTEAGRMARIVDAVTLMFGVLAGEGHENPLSQTAGSLPWLAPPVDPRRVKFAESRVLGRIQAQRGATGSHGFGRTFGRLVLPYATRTVARASISRLRRASDAQPYTRQALNLAGVRASKALRK